jgi:hypothetical protein
MFEVKQSDLRQATPKILVFTPQDADGTLTGVESPVASSSNDLICGAGTPEIVEEGGVSKVKVPLIPGDQHTVGITTITLSSDAELGEGEEPLSYQVEVKVTPDNATGFDVTLE